MKPTPSPSRLVTLALLAGLLASACRVPFARMGQTVTESQSVDAVSATDASVEIQMHAGVLTLAGGADHLLDADFRYNVPVWEPQVAYVLDGAHGALDVTQPDEGRLPVGDQLVNDWNLRLSGGLPLDLAINLGAGEGDLDLSGLDVTKVQVLTGAAVVKVDLRGDWEHDVNAVIGGGLGEVRVLLPSAMGVRVTANTALVNVTASGLTRDGSSYVNATYGASPYTLHVEIEAGVGSVDLEVR
jgi:hypothetical protein